MISYADFDFAITRWKARAGGAPQPAQHAASGMVQSEVPVSTAPEAPGEQESGAVADEAQGVISGVMVSDGLLETPSPESEDELQK
jgi:hypothetical protein